MIFRPCRGGCGTNLLDPQAPKSLFGACLSCLAKSPPINPDQAWRATKELRTAKGLDNQNLTELVDEETGYRNLVVGGAETMDWMEAKYR